MKRLLPVALVLFLGSSFVSAMPQDGPPGSPTSEALYKQHDWFALEKEVGAGHISDPLILGATAAALGQDERARLYLKPLLTGKDADDAHTWLSYIDMRRGHYKEAALHIEAANRDEHNPLAMAFHELPDQKMIATSPATIRCRKLQRKLFVPASVNRHAVEFILDSDANLSYVSEAAAKHLGLSVRRSSATTAGALGAASQFNMTTADVVVGNTILKNVAFMVFPNRASVFTTLRLDQQGALGMSVLLALEQFGWDRDGTFEIGSGYTPSRPSSPLVLDGADPVVRFSYNQTLLTGVFDTGAETTNLWPPFAVRFVDLVHKKGVPGNRKIRGFGGSGTVPELVLPELVLNLGGASVRAQPAHIVTGKTTDNSGWLDGRLGLDLMFQARHVTVDFRNNKVQLAN